MSFEKKKCSFSSSPGAASGVCIWEWPDSQLYTSPTPSPRPHTLKTDEKGSKRKWGAWRLRSCVAVSHPCCTLLCGEDLHPSSRVLSIVVSFCCHSRSSSSSQGKSCLSRQDEALILTSFGALCILWRLGKEQPKRFPVSIFFLESPFRRGYWVPKSAGKIRS